MPLRGDLREFGVHEIFQLLEQQAKTGCLQVRTEIKDIEVYFREGMVVGAFPGGKQPWDHLVGILCRVGYLSEEDVRKLEKRQRSDLTSLKEILRGEALLGPRGLTPKPLNDLRADVVESGTLWAFGVASKLMK